MDNYATHKHPKVKVWLTRHPRFHFHFTPTYSSWLNQVEIFFGIITRQAIRRGSFASVKDLVRRIDTFVETYNRTAKPFAWTATAESIFLKLERLLSRFQGHNTRKRVARQVGGVATFGTTRPNGWAERRNSS